MQNTKIKSSTNPSQRQRRFVQKFDKRLVRMLVLESYSGEELTATEHSELLQLAKWFDLLNNKGSDRRTFIPVEDLDFND